MSSASIIKSAKEHGMNSPLETQMLRTANLADREWRLNNLYHVLNEQRDLVKFQMRPLQKHFYDRWWHRNVLLKSRQVGGTTMIELAGLDGAIFIPNFKVMIISHKKDSAAAILEEKALTPYLNLHPELRERVQLVEQNKSKMTFSNGSSIEVTNSGRSGGGNFLHISELGYIAAKRPDVAREIMSGTLPGFHQGAMVFVESTAEGSSGQFYDMCQTSQNMQRMGQRLTEMDFKFHFYGWPERPENSSSEEEAEFVTIPPRLNKYFDELKQKKGITLSLRQKAWYTVQERVLQQDIKKEHPATPKEAFESSGKGRILDTQMMQARDDGRITEVPMVAGRPIHTFWDIGVNDETSIVFMQNIGSAWHVVKYMEGTDDGMQTWINRVRDLARDNGWLMGDYVGPHDLKKRGTFTGTSLWNEIAAMGVKFEVVPRVDTKKLSITKLRNQFSLLSFDEESCDLLIKHLDGYCWDYDDIRAVYKDKPLHNKASNGADALQQWAMWVDRKNFHQEQLAMGRPDSGSSNISGEGRPQPNRSMRGFL